MLRRWEKKIHWEDRRLVISNKLTQNEEGLASYKQNKVFLVEGSDQCWQMSARRHSWGWAIGLGCTVNLEDNHVGRLVSAVRKTLEEKRSLTMAKVVASKGEGDTAMGEEELWATPSFQNLNSLWSIDMDSVVCHCRAGLWSWGSCLTMKFNPGWVKPLDTGVAQDSQGLRRSRH